MKYTVDLSGWNKLKKQLLTLDKTELRVGWFDTSYGADNDNLPHAFVASLNEFGHVNGTGSLVPGAITPPRPFIRVGFRDYMKTGRGEESFKTIISAVMRGETALQTYSIIGPVLVKGLQTVMDAWDSPPNARLTRELKGFNDPLNETHELIDNVSFEVSRK
jgi:hypothetical protein